MRGTELHSGDAPTPFTERPDGDDFIENWEIKPPPPWEKELNYT